mmetsp:Transcript_7583/g.14216  ORF Transcript_7583/g.14216 Transcript_7583/m.14216 type:complete len:1267 (+) Transcript_7583:4248-8048(+)
MSSVSSFLDQLPTLPVDIEVQVIKAFTNSVFQLITVPEASAMLRDPSKLSYCGLLILELKNSLPPCADLVKLAPHNLKYEVVRDLIRLYKTDAISQILNEMLDWNFQDRETVLGVIESSLELLTVPECESAYSSLQNVEQRLVCSHTSADAIDEFAESSKPDYLQLRAIHKLEASLLKKIDSNELVLRKLESLRGSSVCSLLPYIQAIKSLQGYGWDAEITEGLLHTDPYVRKHSLALLQVLYPFNDYWRVWHEVYQALEEFSSHLVKGVWPRVAEIFARSEYVSWSLILFERACSHINPSVRKYIAKSTMTNTSTPKWLILGPLIRIVNDSALYADAGGLAARSKFGEVVEAFYAKQLLSFTREEIKEFLRVLDKYATFQLSVTYLAKALATVKIPCLDDEATLILANFASTQLEQLTHSQKDIVIRAVTSLTAAEPISPEAFCKLLDTLPRNVALNLSQPDKLKEFVSLEIEVLLRSSAIRTTLKALARACKWVENLDRDLEGLYAAIGQVYRNTYLSEADVERWILFLQELVRADVCLANYKLEAIIPEVCSYLERKVCTGAPIDNYDALLSAFTKVSEPSLRSFKARLEGLLDSYPEKSLKLLIPLLEAFQGSQALAVKIIQLPDNKALSPSKLKALTFLSPDPQTLWKYLEHFMSTANADSVVSVLKLLSKLSPLLLQDTENLKHIITKCRELLREYRGKLPFEAYTTFCDFALSPAHFDSSLGPEYLTELLGELIDEGEDQWQIVRCLTLQVYSIWFKKPELLAQYQPVLLRLATFREKRGPDHDLLLPCAFAVVNIPAAESLRTLSEKGQYVRVLTLKALETFGGPLIELRTMVWERLEHEMRVGDKPNSPFYRLKLHLAQLMCLLTQYVTEPELQSKADSLFKMLDITHVFETRQYIERAAISLALLYPHAFESILASKLQNVNMKIQISASYILIAGALLCFGLDSKLLFDAILPYSTCNVSQARRVAQFVLLAYLDRNRERVALSPVLQYLLVNKECQKMRQRLDASLGVFATFESCSTEVLLQARFNDFDELVETPILKMIDEDTKDLLDSEEPPMSADVFWKMLGMSYETPQVSMNFQRKPEETVALQLERNVRENRVRHPIVVVASLVDKMPNLAGLTRTCEVFNASVLAIPSRHALKDPEFKGMAVTADRWLPIIEVQPCDLSAFLALHRQHGYTLVGVEQTAHSQDLDKFRFPSTTVLVLGAEKSGIPPDILAQLDWCVEIPQFGVVRSLNVHVSGSVCLWEYTKQRYLAN